MLFTRFVRRYTSRLTLPSLLLLAGLLGSVALFAWIMHEVLLEQEEAFDAKVFAMLEPCRTPARTAFMKVVTFGASALFLQIAYGVTILIYVVRRRWLRCVEIFVIGLGGFLINYFMKLSFHRLRPPNPLLDPLTNFSFPSGHATSGFIYYGLLAYLIWKTELKRNARIAGAALLIAWALLIGFSRIYLRMHYASDVLAGFCCGLAWLTLAILLLERQKKNTRKEMRQPEPVKNR